MAQKSKKKKAITSSLTANPRAGKSFRSMKSRKKPAPAPAPKPAAPRSLGRRTSRPNPNTKTLSQVMADTSKNVGALATSASNAVTSVANKARDSFASAGGNTKALRAKMAVKRAAGVASAGARSALEIAKKRSAPKPTASPAKAAVKGKVGGGSRRGSKPKAATAGSTSKGVMSALKKGDIRLAAARVKNAAPSLVKQGKKAASSKFASVGGNTKALRVKMAAKKAAGVASAAGRSASAIAGKKINAAAKSSFARIGGNTKLLRAKAAANKLMGRASNLVYKLTPARRAALLKAQKASAMARRSGRGGM